MLQVIYIRLQLTIYHFLTETSKRAIYKRAKLNNGTYLYWVDEDGKKIDGRFLRQELFAINKQFEK